MAGVKVLHDGRAIGSWTDTSQALSSMAPYMYQINKNKKMFNLNFYPFELFKRRLCSSLAAFNKQTKVKRNRERDPFRHTSAGNDDDHHQAIGRYIGSLLQHGSCLPASQESL